MGWTTMLGKNLDYPYALHTRAINIPMKEASRELVIEVLNRAKAWHDSAMELNAKCNTLREENTRLKHENEFMLRLIADREDE